MSITLNRESVDDASVGGHRHAWALRITAMSSEAGLSSKIFVYHAAMGDDPLIRGDLFEAVASVSQMLELPENAPVDAADGIVVPYYRKDVIEVFCHSASEAEELWGAVKSDVADLINNFASWQNLKSSEQAVITNANPAPSVIVFEVTDNEVLVHLADGSTRRMLLLDYQAWSQSNTPPPPVFEVTPDYLLVRGQDGTVKRIALLNI